MSDLSSKISDAKSAIDDARSDAESIAKDIEKEKIEFETRNSVDLIKSSLSEEKRRNVEVNVNHRTVIDEANFTGSPAALLLKYDDSFWNVEEKVIPPIKVERKGKVYLHKSLYWVALVSLTWGYGNYVRLPSIIYQLTGFWKEDSSNNPIGVNFSIWHFLIPFAVSLICVAWPLQVAEAACGQLAGGGAMKVFGAINTRTRALGSSFLVAIMMCFFLPMYSATSFSYMIRSFANVYESTVNTGSTAPAQDLCSAWSGAQGNTCQEFNHDPENGNRRLLQNIFEYPTTTRYLRSSLIVNHNHQTYHNQTEAQGEGEEQFEMTDAINRILVDTGGSNPWAHCPEPWSMEVYCAYYQFIVTTTDDHPDELMMLTRYDSWDASGNSFSYYVTIGLVVVWLFAGLMSGVGPKYTQYIRPVILLYVVGITLAVLIKAIIDVGDFSAISLTFGGSTFDMTSVWNQIDVKQLARPELWAVAISQSLLTMGIAQGILPDQQYKNDRYTQNVVVDQSINMFSDSCLSLLMSFLCVMLLGTAASPGPSQSSGAGATQQINAIMGQVAYSNPMSEIFVVSSAFFGTVDGSKSAWSFCWFLGLFLLGVNSLSALLESIVTGFAGAVSKNENLPRGVWTAAWACILFATNVIFSWACGYPFSTELGHIAVEFALTIMAYLELLGIGWVLHIKKNFRHLGKTATWMHMILYHLGCWTAGISTGLLYAWGDKDTGMIWGASGSGTVWQRWIGLVIGLVLMILAVTIPPLFAHKVNFDNKPQTMGMRYKYMLWGQVESLRHEINLACCYNTKIWRLTPVWTCLIKYIAPFAVVFSASIPFTCLMQLNEFSSYYPFLHQWAYWQHKISGYSYELALPWVYQFFAILIPSFCLLWGICVLILPWLMSYCTPPDAKEIIFDFLDAQGNLANETFVQYKAEGINAVEAVAGPEIVQKAALDQEEAMKKRESLSSLVSSRESEARSRQRSREREDKKLEKKLESEESSRLSELESEEKKRRKEAKKEAKRLESEASSLRSAEEKRQEEIESIISSIESEKH